MREAPNRMLGLRRFYAARDGEDSLQIKNMAECMSAHSIVEWTAEELKLLPDGPGARRYWQHTKCKRPDLIEKIKCLHAGVNTLGIVKSSGATQKHRPSFKPADLDEEFGQYWSCAQQRILCVADKSKRSAANVVPRRLWPNERLISFLKKAWESTANMDDDEDTDDSDDNS